ncbi:hypothetical protein N7931_07810 [Catenovulum sp. 2E275]|uniref:hypothetical protein n=1 Tax=Catenovulum sp. 2E275 TaxID=2980497 RepID=UPI0021CF192E|nr:hypothetical protein [Catenovulum sp. 2E275]MCU4675540.1 hypothetical protein [Catenovulum sp. 2E275]
MPRVSRRTLIKLFGIIPSAAIASHFSLNAAKYDSVLEQAWQAWQQNLDIKPLPYLQATKITNLPEAEKQKLIQQEFAEDKVISVNGLVLSYIETAILAQLYLEQV